MNGKETVEERIVRLETKQYLGDRRWDEYIKRQDEKHEEVIESLKSMDEKVDAILIREAGREGEKREHRNMSARISGAVSLVVAGVISAVVNSFK